MLQPSSTHAAIDVFLIEERPFKSIFRLSKIVIPYVLCGDVTQDRRYSNISLVARFNQDYFLSHDGVLTPERVKLL